MHSSDASQLLPQHNYKLDVHALNARQPGEVLTFLAIQLNHASTSNARLVKCNNGIQDYCSLGPFNLTRFGGKQ